MRIILLVITLLVIGGCQGDGAGGLGGELRFAGVPLSGASVEIYLKAEKDRKTQPFAVTETDAAGRYRVALPPGSYFVIGKKKETAEDGRPRMLMAECPSNPVLVDRGPVTVPTFALEEMGRSGRLVAEPGTFLHGRVVTGGEPVAHAFVYVYTDGNADLKGPSYAASVETDAAGEYRIPLPGGRFWLAARRRELGGRLGEPSPGDLNGLFPGNPVRLERGEEKRLADLPLSRVGADSFRRQMAEGKFAATPTAFTGRVVDADGTPVAGIYLFAYADSGMVGKPTYISAATGADGLFRLNLGAGGAFYIGARSSFGGPLEPGEWVGTYDLRVDHRAEVETGAVLNLGPISVREIW